MGLSLSSGVFRFIVSALLGAGTPFFIPSPTIRFPERAQWGQGTETLAKLGACRLAALVFGSALSEGELGFVVF